MSRPPVPTQRKVFTLQQANATLPLVRAIVGDLVELSREVFERRHRLALLFEGRQRDAFGPYRDELAQIEEDLDRDTARLQEYAEELEQLGVELRSATEGLIDFPAIIEDRLVFLCWKLGEPEVGFWHELDAGYQGRQPLSRSRLPGGLPSTF